MSTKDAENQQRTGKGQAPDPRTGRDEDDHIVLSPRTGSVYEEDADSTTQPEHPYDAQALRRTKRTK
jgi:hypothetical protein